MHTRQPSIERALETVSEEIQLVSAECDAFASFTARVRDVAVDSPSGSGMARAGGATLSAPRGQSTSGLATVRSAYRETVMAVDHYDEEYGDSLGESLATEFGPDLAAGLLDGGDLTPVVVEAVTGASERAQSDREALLEHLRRERRSLRDSEDELDAVESRAVDLGARRRDATRSTDLARLDEELVGLQERCSGVADRRQDLIHERTTRMPSGTDDCTLLRYLYGDAEATCPVLRDVAACLETIRYHRLRCLR